MFHVPELLCCRSGESCMFTDYITRLWHSCLPNSPVVEEPSPSKRDTEARFQAHLARYRTLNTKRAVAAAGGNGQKQKIETKNKKEGVEDSSRGLFRNGFCMYLGIVTTLTKSVVFRRWIAANHGESLACRCDLSPNYDSVQQLRPPNRFEQLSLLPCHGKRPYSSGSYTTHNLTPTPLTHPETAAVYTSRPVVRVGFGQTRVPAFLAILLGRRGVGKEGRGGDITT